MARRGVVGDAGQTVAPLDSTFRLMGGGPDGSIGAAWSLVVGAVACAGVVLLLRARRARRKRFRFPLRPWRPKSFSPAWRARRLLPRSRSSTPIRGRPEACAVTQKPTTSTFRTGGLFIAHGIAIPVLIAIGVGIAVTFLATRTRFGRYVYAIGGNPEAAELAGVNTRRVIVKVFMLMGLLAAISGAVSIARLNAATNAEGTLAELLVIAAAVIGGTSLAGGVGTVPGAMLGALLMQSLQSGMVLLGVDTPLQSIVVGAVLVVAVGIDTAYRRRLR